MNNDFHKFEEDAKHTFSSLEHKVTVETRLKRPVEVRVPKSPIDRFHCPYCHAVFRRFDTMFAKNDRYTCWECQGIFKPTRLSHFLLNTLCLLSPTPLILLVAFGFLSILFLFFLIPAYFLTLALLAQIILKPDYHNPCG